MYDYQFWGRRLKSDLPLPELVPWEGSDCPPEIVIRQGSLGLHLAGEFWQDAHARLARDGRFQVDDPGIARYQGRDGHTVIIQPLCNPEDEASQAVLREILYATVMGGLSLQRRLLPLHANSLVIGGRALMLLGSRAMGKSAISAVLHRRGYPVLADDLSVVETGLGTHHVLPGFPGLRLTPQVADHFGALSQFRGPRQRQILSPLPGAGMAPAPLGATLFLQRDDQTWPPKLVPLSPMAAVAQLNENIFRSSLALAMGRSSALFATCAHLAAQIPRHFVLRYASGLDRLERLADVILDAVG